MLVKRLADCAEFIAGDNTRLRELLHPERDPATIGHSLARARLGPGQSSLKHRLEQAEIYHVISGTGRMHVGDESAEVGPGDTVLIPAASVQWLENTGTAAIEFLCIVDPAWTAAGETVVG